MTFKAVVHGNVGARIVEVSTPSTDMLAVRQAFAAVMVSGEQIHGMIALVGDAGAEQRFNELTAQTFPELV